ncbi:MAG: CHAT domain-containing protein, partial [Candidatus Zixiibacteriota bacterium]
LVELNIHLNQFGTAIMLGEDAGRRFEALGMRYERAKTHYFVGLAQLHLGDYGHASKSFRLAHTLFAQENNLLWQGMVGIARSRLEAAQEKHSSASRQIKGAIRLLRASGDERRQIDAEIVHIETLLGAGRFTDASRQARRLLKRNLSATQQHRLYHQLGECCFARQNYVQAQQYYHFAIAAAEKMLISLYPDEIRFFFLLDKFDSYRRVIECRLKRGRTTEALQHNWAALATLNHRAGTPGIGRAGVPKRLLESRSELRAALKKLSLAPVSPSTQVRAASGSSAVEQRLWHTERRIRSYQYPGKAAASAPVTFRTVQQFIHPNETVISYFAGSDELGVFCVTRDSLSYSPLGVDKEELGLMLRKLHFLLETAVLYPDASEHQRTGVDTYLNNLYDLLIRPLADYVRDRQVIFVVDDMVAQIPLATLTQYADRASDRWRDLRIIINPFDMTGRRAQTHDFTATRNAVFAVSSPLLPAVDLEARSIKEAFPRTRLCVNDKATLRRLVDQLATADGFVHIAAHASRMSENPLFSRVLMADGPFFPFDLFGMGVRAKLVTLSGCQTAAPGLYYGNTFSLGKAFYQAGSQYVLASLWPVSDKLTMIFMAAFYKSLRSEGNVFTAYKEAVQCVKAISTHPAFWSGFVLMGL